MQRALQAPPSKTALGCAWFLHSVVPIPAWLRKRGYGFGAEAVQTWGSANIELVAKRNLVPLPPRVSRDCPTLCAPLTPSAALHCLELGLLGKGNKTLIISKHLESTVIGLGNLRQSLGCSSQCIKQLQLWPLSLPPVSSKDVQSPKTPASSPRLPEPCQADSAGCCLLYLHLSVNVLIILALAVFGGRERGRRHVWDPVRWQEEKTTEIEDWRGNGDKLSFRNFPKAGVVSYSEHRVLSDACLRRWPEE